MIGLKEYYWCFIKAIPEKICDEIVKYGNSQVFQKGMIGPEGNSV